jgi:hypothetical protein
MPSLRSTLTALAENFAASVLEAMRAASLDDLLSESGARGGRAADRPAAVGAHDDEENVPPARARRPAPGRPPRGPAEDLQKTLDLLSKLLKSHPKGLRAEEIQQMLGISARGTSRLLKQGLATKKLASKGTKKATTYLAGGPAPDRQLSLRLE